MAPSEISDLENLYKQAKSTREPLEGDWYLNVAYYHGDQWVWWNKGRIDKPQVANWRIMLVDNRILPTAFSRVARKTKNKPSFVATPNSYDESDLNASEVATKALEDDWIQLNLQHKLFSAQMWSEIVCAGFWKIYWDKTKGDYSEDYMFDPEGELFLNQNDRPMRAADAGALAEAPGYSTKAVSTGNVAVDVLSPFNIVVDPLAEELEDCEFIIEEHVRSTEYIKKHYNKEVEADTDVPIGITESRMFPTLNSSGSTSDKYRGITIYELYAKSSSKYQGGRRAAWSKNEMLEEDNLENSPFSGCPYVMFSGIKVPGRFWPTSITSQLRGPQTELNKVKSQIRENALRIGNPSLMKSRQANIFYSGVPGEELLYDSTVIDAVPSYLQPPEMPIYVQNEVDRIENSITEISGIHEVSKATVPSGVTAASAINLLQEADDTRLGPEIYDMENSLGQAGGKLLKLRAKYQDDERLIRTAGEDGEWDIQEFRGKMLENVSNVEVQAGSAMPRSKAAKQAAMQEMLGLMLQYGLDINPRDLRKFMRDYGVGGLEHMFASLSQVELQIRREHNFFMDGIAIDINDFDVHDTHIEGHNEFRMSRRYWRMSDEHKEVVDAHVEAHQEARVEMVNEQLKAQMTEMPPP